MLVTDFVSTLGSRLTIRRCLRLYLMVLALLAATTNMAQEIPLLPVDAAKIEEEEVRLYSVEIIVFKYDDSVSAGTEIFSPEPIEELLEPLSPIGMELETGTLEQSDQSQDVELEEIVIPEYGDFLGDGEEIFLDEELVEIMAGDRINLKVFMPDELTLTDVHEKLVLLDAYQPVMWGGWIQSTLTEDETPFIDLRRLGNLPLDFEGELKLYLSRFLHLVVDVALDENVPPPENAGYSSFDSRIDRGYYGVYSDNLDSRRFGATPVPVIHYRIFEDRIMKSGDIRYFDHPKFGVLVKVDRYEVPEAEEEEETADIPFGTLLSEQN